MIATPSKRGKSVPQPGTVVAGVCSVDMLCRWWWQWRGSRCHVSHLHFVGNEGMDPMEP